MNEGADASGVIIADDDGMIRDVLRSKLAAIGQTVFLASDGLEAVALAAQVKAALIIMDLIMPRLNGLLACERIRKLPNHGHTPIVVLTSAHGDDVEAAAARIGATTFLTKPFRSAQVLHELARFLPIDEATRGEINRSFDRAVEIAASRPGGLKGVSEPGSDRR